MHEQHARRWQTGLVLAMALLGLWARSQLAPDARVPVHFNAAGVVDGWGSPTLGLLLLPGIAAAMWGLQRLIVALEPRHGVPAPERERQAAATRAIFVAVIGLFAWIQCIVVATALSDWRPSALHFLLPLALLLLVVGRTVFGLVDPRDPLLASSSRAVRTLRWVGLAALAAPVVLAVHAALGGDVDLPQMMLAGTGLCLLLVGNVMGKLRPNARVGIRTPWTLANSRVWEQTHRFGGKAFVLGGLVLMGLAATPLAARWHAPVVVVTTLGISAAVVLKSYRLWRSWRDGSAAGSDDTARR